LDDETQVTPEQIKDREEATQVYLFDDFTVGADDPGIEVPVVLLGRFVPILFKRGLTLEETAAARNAGLKKRMNKQGQLEILSLDETAIQLATVVRAIKDWPFKQRDGAKVPVTLENIKKLSGSEIEALFIAFSQLTQAREQALVPFAATSDDL